MFNYAQINQNGYCIGISSLSGEVYIDDMVLIPEYDTGYINRRYDHANKVWLDEYFIPPKPIAPVSLDDIKSDTSTIGTTTSQTSADVLSNIELELDTNSRVALSQEDGLMLMEMLLAIQTQLNSITPPTQV